ncbi:hypothetical protein MKW92_033342 [Papaver armeniacum]|nr:hypothetical protein MKW92_033342 [Papaver armeniacum]
MSPIMFYELSFFAVLLVSSNIFVEAAIVGVNYGRVGDNLPSPTAVVNLLRSKNVDKVRLFSPDSDALNALRGSGIGVVLGVPNSDVQRMGNDPSFARNWVNTNVVAFGNVQFRYISVGNEIDIPRAAESGSILPAMNNIRDALRAAGRTIPVSTTTFSGLIVDSFPPSKGRFSDGAQNIMRSIVRFLVDNRTPLLVNIYPYFAYTGNPQQIPLDYALFTANRVVAIDNNNGLQYRNLFDAMTDATYAAIEKVGGSSIDIVITESGWPSGQNANIATIPNARTYVNNLISHVSGTNGTPRRPGRSIETYIFALFNENLKSGLPTERHFGLYYPDMSEIFPVTFQAGVVGVNYGRNGNNLPSPTEVVKLLRSRNIDRIRLFSPDSDALNALRGSGIGVVLGVPNPDVQKIGNDPDFARNWINTKVVAFSDVQFRYISVGNEIEIPSDAASNAILPAMKNLNNALKAAGRTIPVSTTIKFSLVRDSFPPSKGRFSDDAQNIMRSIVEFLEANRSPLLVNIYPYISYNDDPQKIALDYALFTADRVVAIDNANGLQYKNLFDAMTDAAYTAIEKVGGSNVDIVIAESGWPSGENGNIATIPNARTYVNNLISHVSGTSGTPKKPGKSIETYIFALFNENMKDGLPTERHFGLYFPDMTEIYPVTFP